LLQRNQHHYDYLYLIRLRKLLIANSIRFFTCIVELFFLGIQAGILARTPAMIYTDHGRPLVESKIEVLMDRFSGYFVDKIVAVSNELQDYLIKQIKLSKEKIITLINGIDTDKYSFREKSQVLMKELGITKNDKIIGTVGRLAEVKDQISLIEAFSIVHQKIANTVLILVGDGPMRNELTHKINALNLNDRVKITGNRTDVPALLNIFDLFVLSSLSEGTSVALLEAMSSGLAPIVTNVGGNPSLVDDNVNGLLISTKNVEELSGKLIYLLKDDETRNKFGENASRKIREKFSITKMVKEYENLYSSLLNKKH